MDYILTIFLLFGLFSIFRLLWRMELWVFLIIFFVGYKHTFRLGMCKWVAWLDRGVDTWLASVETTKEFCHFTFPAECVRRQLLYPLGSRWYLPLYSLRPSSVSQHHTTENVLTQVTVDILIGKCSTCNNDNRGVRFTEHLPCTGLVDLHNFSYVTLLWTCYVSSSRSYVGGGGLEPPLWCY